MLGIVGVLVIVVLVVGLSNLSKTNAELRDDKEVVRRSRRASGVMKPICWAIVIAVLVNSSMALAQNERDDGYFYYPACVAFLKILDENIPPPDQRMLIGAGSCHGIMLGVFGMHRFYSSEWAFCPPPGTQVVTAMRIVVSWLGRNPQRMPGQFLATAHAAMSEAWPCEGGRPRK